MKRYITCLLAPLLTMALMSFNLPDNHQGKSKDSTQTVNVQFSPARVIVSDNRTTDAVTSLIKENSESNVEVAGAIERLAEVLLRNYDLQERRCASYMDRISTETGLSIDQINKIVHKKRVYDITFYTLFSLYILYVMFGISSMTYHANAVNMKEWGIKIISGLVSIALFYLAYLAIGAIFNGPYYPVIQSIINSPPG